MDKDKSTSNKTVEVPVELIEAVIDYCEVKQIYDKLSNFNDFYYKLKQLL